MEIKIPASVESVSPRSNKTLITGGFIVFHILCSSVAIAASFEGLGDIEGGLDDSIAYGVSADGLTVAGKGNGDAGYEAFVWKQNIGLLRLGVLGPGSSEAHAVSADGTYVIGGTSTADGYEAFRWSAESGMVVLGQIEEGDNSSIARGISDDGTIIVGRGITGPDSIWEAFRMEYGSEMVGLGDIPGGFTKSEAYSVSADGSIIVGYSHNNGNEPFRWTHEDGMVSLGKLPGTSNASAYDISADGTVIVGVSDQKGFVWSETSGMIEIGDLPGGIISSSANGVSSNGSIVVGESVSSSGYEAIIWDSVYGIRTIKSVLVTEYGLNLDGWTLTAAQDISADGSTIVGFGTNPEGKREAWIVRLVDIDSDGDGIFDKDDNCPLVANYDQKDTDGNGIGDACNDENDLDGDEWADAIDNCQDLFNPSQDNEDGDELGDACDPFPLDSDNLGACIISLDEYILLVNNLELENAALQETVRVLEDQLTDTDEDGIIDSYDICSNSQSSDIDNSGCTIAQFCSTYSWPRYCNNADWKNDEPLNAHDCNWNNNQCLPR